MGWVIVFIFLVVLLSSRRVSSTAPKSSHFIPTPSSVIPVSTHDSVRLHSPLKLWQRYQSPVI